MPILRVNRNLMLSSRYSCNTTGSRCGDLKLRRRMQSAIVLKPAVWCSFGILQCVWTCVTRCVLFPSQHECSELECETKRWLVELSTSVQNANRSSSVCTVLYCGSASAAAVAIISFYLFLSAFTDTESESAEASSCLALPCSDTMRVVPQPS